MKRNRLLRPSNRTSLFSEATNKLRTRRNLLGLSTLSLAGIFVTTIVLATNKPVVGTTQSLLIDLPNLSPASQASPQYNAVSTMSVVKSANPALAIINTAELTIDETIEISLMDKAKILKSAYEAEATALEQQQFAATASVEPAISWQQVTVKSGDNLSLIFPRVGLSARDVYNIVQLGKDVKPLLNLKPGQILRFAFKTQQEITALDKLELKLSDLQTLSITSSDDGYRTSMATSIVDSRQTQAFGQIKNSLFEAGIAAGLSDKVVMELAYIFGWDIDFSLDLRKGDHFMLIYEEDYLDGEKIADGEILAAEFTNHGKIYRAVRYTNAAGITHYYAPNGDSMRKTFSRSPVHFSRISSKFNPSRKHPILKTNRPHRGVDYVAKRGTPITATGDGKVSFIGRKGGYGRTVVLSHGGKYTTLYAHMSNYRKELRAGRRVQQGDVIGYIGSSGLATGSHLHYEFRVSGVHRNPLTISLPKAEPLEKKYFADFKQKSESLLAQLDRIGVASLALNN